MLYKRNISSTEQTFDKNSPVYGTLQPVYFPYPNNKEVLPMEKLTAVIKARKPLSFQTTQLIYGVSILLTFGVVGQIALRL